MNLADSLLGKDAEVAAKASVVRPGAKVHRLSDVEATIAAMETRPAPSLAYDLAITSLKSRRDDLLEEGLPEPQPEPVRVTEADLPDDEIVTLPDSLADEDDSPYPLIALVESLPPPGTPMPEKKLFALTTAITAMLEFFYGAA